MIDAAALVRPIRDCLAQRLGQSRGSQWGLHLQWDSDQHLGTSSGLDSIELLDAADAVCRLFALDLPGWEDYLLRDQRMAGWADVAAAALQQHGRMRFRSSGTQGPASEPEHLLDRLVDEADELSLVFGRRQRVLCAVPTQHIFGFIFGVLLPRALNAEPRDFCGLPPSTITSAARSGDLVVAHPMIWQRLADSRHVWPADVVGASSTAPLAASVVAQLRDNGLSRLVEVYGSSETAGIGWRDAADSGFRLFRRWTIDPHDTTQLVDSDGSRHPFPDRVDVDDGSVRPLSRHDHAVQVAGQNVHPERIAQLLQAHPAVDAAQVRLDTDSGRLKAFIVPSREGAADAADLRRWCQARLSAAEVPARFDFGAALPRGVLGKPADW